MRRVWVRGAMGLAAVALTLTACSTGGIAASSAPSPAATTANGVTANGVTASGLTSPDAVPDAAELTIQPVEAVDLDGHTVEIASGTAVDPAGAGDATCAGIVIGMAGALTGPNAAIGQNILGGVKLALDKHNKANPNCQVDLKPFDTDGTVETARAVAVQIVGDVSIIGLVGPGFSDETEATGDDFNKAGLLSLTPSATLVSLTTHGWDNFFRGLPSDAQQGAAAAGYLKTRLGYTRVCVVRDDSAYGAGLADAVKEKLGGVADRSCEIQVKAGDREFLDAVNSVKASAPDAVFYAGDFAEGAPLAQQLVDAGVTATFMAGDGSNDPEFVARAGSAAKGALLSCTCGPPVGAFAAEFLAFNQFTAGIYSVEGYDLTTVILSGIDAGVTDRAALVEYVKTYSGEGIGRTYQWDNKGELTGTLPVWIYRVA